MFQIDLIKVNLHPSDGLQCVSLKKMEIFQEQAHKARRSDAIAISNMKLLGYAIACKNKQQKRCHRFGYLITNGVGKSKL